MTVQKDSKTDEFDLMCKIQLNSNGSIQEIFKDANKQLAEKFILFFDSITRPMLHEHENKPEHEIKGISSSAEIAQKKYQSDMDRYEAAEKLAAEFKKYLEAL